MKIYIAQGNETMTLPINPSSLKVSEKSKNRQQTVISLGDVNIPDVRGLSEFKLDAFFPHSWNHYCSISSTQLKKPIEYISLITKFKNSEKPVRIIFSGNAQSVVKANNNPSGLFLIEDMDYDIKAGEENDVYYSIKFKQYRNYEPRVVTVNKNTSGASNSVILKPTVRPIPQPLNNMRKHSVKSGENLWDIARKYYGDGTQYMRIANKNGISTPSLIYPGQVLIIP